jgi:hypothetical protein
VKKNLFLLLVCFLVVVPFSASADQDVDMRLKFGSAAEADKFKLEYLNRSGSGQSSGNLAFEVIVNQHQAGSVGFLFGGGFFARRHSGNDRDPVQPTDVDYKAAGAEFIAGVGIRATESLHFEGKLELGYGAGEPTFAPGFWYPTEPDNYSSVSVILGSYYTFAKPGFQIGLELGYQSFSGDFKIWNTSGYWMDGTIEGSSATANVVLGYRF